MRERRTLMAVAVAVGLSACVQLVGIEEATLGTPNGAGGGMGSSSASGGGMSGQSCAMNTDCPATGSECRVAVCIDMVCATTNTPDGIPTAGQTPADCLQIQCDGAGNSKTVPDDSDVPLYDCYMTTCAGGMEVKVPTPQGTSCKTNGGNFCDGNGTCIECNTDADCSPTGEICDPKSHTCFKCDDNLQNGDESDVDCGGNRCPDCTQGKKCKVIQDCAAASFCADGVCCNSECNQQCESCNLPNSVGTCDFVAKYEDDPSYGMGMSCVGSAMKTCNGVGACRGALGAACTGPTDCASGKCGVTKICVKTTGDSCNMPAECFSGLCTNGVCN